MTTPLQSPEYAALVAAKEARDKAYAHKANVEREYLDAALYEGVGELDQIFTKSGEYLKAHREALEADAAVTAAQAAFDAAYPAPADVVAAVEAVKTASIAVWATREAFNKSLTQEQIALDAEAGNAQIALDAAVTHAKGLIEAAQVSPSKAFVVRKSVKTDVTVEANRAIIFEAALNWKLPETLLTIDEAALIKWIEDNPTTAETFNASITRTEIVKASVAFYAAKL